MSEEIVHKILNNTASEAEKSEFFDSLEKDSEKKLEFLHYKNLYVLSNLNPDQYREQQHISFSNFWNRVHSSQTHKLTIQWMRYAAIFIFASFLGFMSNYLLNPKKSTLVSDRIEFTSSKGSVSKSSPEGWLRYLVKLVYKPGHRQESEDGETIARLDGEAYFKMVPSTGRKFIVNLRQFQVRDIGTVFNVRAYETENTISTTLINGQIDLIKNSGETFLTVKPGEHATYDKTSNNISVNKLDASVVTAWKDGRFVFIDQPLSEICKELERWYNIEIQIQDQKLADTRYTCVVKRSTTVEMVLSILSITDQIHYEITNKKEGKDIIKIRK